MLQREVNDRFVRKYELKSKTRILRDVVLPSSIWKPVEKLEVPTSHEVEAIIYFEARRPKYSISDHPAS